MNRSFTRRQFLATSGSLVAGAGAASLLLNSSSAAEAKPRIVLGTRDVMLRATGKPCVWSAAASIEAEGIEVNFRDDLSFPDLFHPEKKYTGANQAGIDAVKADAQAAGRRLTAFCMSNHFDERPDAEVEWCTKAAQIAQALGVKAVRIDVVPRKIRNRDEFLELSVATLKRVIAATESTGVCFGIENHGNTTNDPAFLEPLLERVGSKRLGLTLDVGNFYWFGHPLSKVYEFCETFAARVFHTHCKSIKYPAELHEQQRKMGLDYGKNCCPIYAGDVDYARVIAILRKAGYANDLCIENESLSKFPKAEQGDVLAKEIQYLKGLL
jgi:sugar phosphate isomerase/epimerase